MLTDAELENLYRDMETDRAERKAVYAQKREEIRQAICAFANDLPNHRRPGVLFIGQRDDGSCANIGIDDELLKTLGGLRSDGVILPFPAISVRRLTIDGCTVAAIMVQPHSQPPVRVEGRTWIRVGPRRGTATVEEERILSEKQTWRNVAFDMRPCSEASLDDLDLIRIEQEYVPSATSAAIRRQNGRSTVEKLRALRLLTPANEPTNAAILMFGIDPRYYFTGAYIQFLRISGTQLTDPIKDQKEISGSAPDQVRQLDELLRLNIVTSAIPGGERRQEAPDYPLGALEQITRNAIMHRNYDTSTSPVRVYWYDDRVEVHSPGGLYGEVTPENIWSNVTSYRNPGLAEGLKTLGIVDRFGFGLLKTRQLLNQNGSPDLEFDFQGNFTLFTLRSRP